LYLPLILTYNLIDAVGEEPGWRGFALPRLQQKYGPLLGSLILGVLHALWHLPGLFVIGWLGPFTLPGFVVFLLVGIATTLVWTWILNNTKGSILIAILLHSASNANTSLLGKLLPTPTPAVLQEGTLLIYGAYILCALLIIAFTKGRLSYKPDRVAQPAEASLVVESTESS
jgi:membrane protease YdiL (CAAX protease family)